MEASKNVITQEPQTWKGLQFSLSQSSPNVGLQKSAQQHLASETGKTNSMPGNKAKNKTNTPNNFATYFIVRQ